MKSSLVTRTGRAVTVIVTAALTGAVLTAAPAAAAPAGCAATLSGKAATATCTSGDGEFRVGIVCGRDRPVFFEWQQFGPWVTVGKMSKIKCAPNAQYAEYAFVETR